ncbi:MAG: GrdX family protein [Synergistaceae bacterium]|nr:GrdX family protein [Synergistaceae bacterium]
MRKDVVLITNNPCFQQLIEPPRLTFLHGTSLDVLTTARDAVHLGSELLTHPLYGNLRPSQQPFRSILLKNPQPPQREGGKFVFPAYLESISAIEDAVLLYAGYGSRLLAPESLTDAAREDCAFVDSELMRDSLTLYGLMRR